MEIPTFFLREPDSQHRCLPTSLLKAVVALVTYRQSDLWEWNGMVGEVQSCYIEVLQNADPDLISFSLGDQ